MAPAWWGASHGARTVGVNHGARMVGDESWCPHGGRCPHPLLHLRNLLVKALHVLFERMDLPSVHRHRHTSAPLRRLLRRPPPRPPPPLLLSSSTSQQVVTRPSPSLPAPPPPCPPSTTLPLQLSRAATLRRSASPPPAPAASCAFRVCIEMSPSAARLLPPPPPLLPPPLPTRPSPCRRRRRDGVPELRVGLLLFSRFPAHVEAPSWPPRLLAGPAWPLTGRVSGPTWSSGEVPAPLDSGAGVRVL